MRKISLKELFCPKSLESKQIILTMKITLFLLLFVTFRLIGSIYINYPLGIDAELQI